MAFGSGYGIGVFLRWLWLSLELPSLDARILKYARILAAIICLITMLMALHQTASWQNSIRSVLSMEPVESGYPFSVSALALVSFGVLLLLARGIIVLGRTVINKLNNYLPAEYPLSSAQQLRLLLYSQSQTAF